MLRKPRYPALRRDLGDLRDQPARERFAAAPNADHDEAALRVFRFDDLMRHARDRPLDLGG
jgi:hypothetical protein